MNEHIEILEAAIDFKNDSITSRQLDISQIVQEEEISSDIQQKFRQLSPEDCQMLLMRYVEKVVHLRLSEAQHNQVQKEMGVNIAEQQDTIHRLERSLRRAQVDIERRLLSQQKVCTCNYIHTGHYSCIFK